MPTGGILAFLAQLVALPPVIRFADIPRIDLDEQGKCTLGSLCTPAEFSDPFQGLGQSHIRIAQAQGTLALPARFTVHTGLADLQAGQPLDIRFGLARRALQHHQCAYLLHPRGRRRTFL